MVSTHARIARRIGIVQQGSGYSNLMSHMSNKSCFGITLAKRKDQAAYHQGMQPAWRAYHESTKADNKTFEPKISSRAKNIFGWIDMIVNGNNALSIVSNPLYKTYIKLDPIGPSYIEETSNHVS